MKTDIFCHTPARGWKVHTQVAQTADMAIHGGIDWTYCVESLPLSRLTQPVLWKPIASRGRSVTVTYITFARHKPPDYSVKCNLGKLSRGRLGNTGISNGLGASSYVTLRSISLLWDWTGSYFGLVLVEWLSFSQSAANFAFLHLVRITHSDSGRRDHDHKLQPHLHFRGLGY